MASAPASVHHAGDASRTIRPPAARAVATRAPADSGGSPGIDVYAVAPRAVVLEAQAEPVDGTGGRGLALPAAGQQPVQLIAAPDRLTSVRPASPTTALRTAT